VPAESTKNALLQTVFWLGWYKIIYIVNYYINNRVTVYFFHSIFIKYTFRCRLILSFLSDDTENVFNKFYCKINDIPEYLFLIIIAT